MKIAPRMIDDFVSILTNCFHQSDCIVVVFLHDYWWLSGWAYVLWCRHRVEYIKEEKDLRVLMISNNLKTSSHIAAVVNKANQIIGLIRRSFTYMDRPHLESSGIPTSKRRWTYWSEYSIAPLEWSRDLTKLNYDVRWTFLHSLSEEPEETPLRRVSTCMEFKRLTLRTCLHASTSHKDRVTTRGHSLKLQ